jgi:transmembrane sensor
MKNFAQYTVEDFAAEPLFIKWVQQPDDAELSNFWQVWLKNHPYKSDEVSEARALVGQFSDAYMGMSAQDVRTLWKRVIETVNTIPEIDPLDQEVKPLASAFYLVRWLIAFVVGVVLLGWIFWKIY